MRISFLEKTFQIAINSGNLDPHLIFFSSGYKFSLSMLFWSVSGIYTLTNVRPKKVLRMSYYDVSAVHCDFKNMTRKDLVHVTRFFISTIPTEPPGCRFSTSPICIIESLAVWVQ